MVAIAGHEVTPTSRWVVIVTATARGCPRGSAVAAAVDPDSSTRVDAVLGEQPAAQTP
jgi:hypothetical protein